MFFLYTNNVETMLIYKIDNINIYFCWVKLCFDTRLGGNGYPVSVDNGTVCIYFFLLLWLFHRYMYWFVFKHHSVLFRTTNQYVTLALTLQQISEKNKITETLTFFLKKKLSCRVEGSFLKKKNVCNNNKTCTRLYDQTTNKIYDGNI